jgi:hypothetical protein
VDAERYVVQVLKVGRGPSGSGKQYRHVTVVDTATREEVKRWSRCFVGSSPDCAYQVALVRANELCRSLNATAAQQPTPVERLVDAMRRLPGIQVDCTSGPDQDSLGIWFVVTDFQSRGLLTLSRLLSPNYYAFGRRLRVRLDHRDIHPQVCFLLEGSLDSETFACAQQMAAEIDRIVDRNVNYYNILYDEVAP